MIIYRLAIETYKDDLSGIGSKIYGGRWNSPGMTALYTSENISLSVLEIIVNTDKYSIPPSYFLLKLTVKDDITVKKINPEALKKNWQTDFEYSQFIGSAFLRSGSEAVLKVPSAVVKEEHNYILNPLHPDFKKITISESTPFDFDIRLLKKNE